MLALRGEMVMSIKNKTAGRDPAALAVKHSSQPGEIIPHGGKQAGMIKNRGGQDACPSC
jgi:hypothetical protein